MPELVKGAGFNRAPARRDLGMDEVFGLSQSAETALYEATKQGLANPQGVAKSFSPSFMPQLGNFMAMGGVGNGAAIQELLEIVSAEVGKNITLTSPLSTGLVPFDLAKPSKLIYPTYSPLRNRIPRTPGAGTSHRAKIITAISGSQTGQPILDVAIPELVTGAGSLNNWPLNLPPSGAQTAVDWNIPYKFFGVSESASFLAQYAGQGFEDAYALANFILMQEALQAEEYQIMEATGTAVTAPSITLATRAPGANETAISGSPVNVYVRVTATNFFGETVASTVQHVAVGTSSEVIDVTITPSRGASQYKVYAGTGSTDPGVGGSFFVVAQGGTKYTLQGAVPVTGPTPPTADTGTSSSYRYEGLLSVLDGHAVTDASVYPAGFDGGYINKNVGNTLVSSVVDTALEQLWDLSSNSFRANPAELMGEGSDIVRLSNDIKTNTALNYRLNITQDEVGGMRGGAAISEYVNPVTRSTVAITVHPWQRQGVAYLLSYTLPQPYSNVSNVMENVMVQDLVGIQWPVIDASYRSSAFWYGTFAVSAPQYCAVLGGLQTSSATPWA